jgi:hypothetical protein
MSIHFPAANVTGYEPLVAGMLISPSDRHVLAAAVRGHADVIVTENVKDFPAEHVELYDVAVSHQDVFLLDLLDLDPVAVRRALTRQVSRYRRQPRTVPELLVALGSAGNGCAGFAAAARAG